MSLLCVSLLAIAWLTYPEQPGMPTRKQRKQWKRERIRFNPRLK